MRPETSLEPQTELCRSIPNVDAEWEAPRLEWHGGRPFAITRSSLAYAQVLESVALEHEASLVQLPVARRWRTLAKDHPTTSRYHSYNAFLLDHRTLPLYVAVRHLLRLLRAKDAEPAWLFLQAWVNVHRAGQYLPRHRHNAPFIGYFAARTAGSTTTFGNASTSSEQDFPVQNRDGQLLVTVGKDHWHEMSPWREAHPRVSFAFDIIDQSTALQHAASERALIPLDGPDLPSPSSNSSL